MQSLPLSQKIEMTERRIREWVDEFGIDGVYVSFSGGKDSTVLLDIARKIFPKMKAVFIDTGLEYPEIRDFVRSYDNVEWIKPKKNFKQVINEYGYPLISKDVAGCVYDAKKYLMKLIDNGDVQQPIDLKALARLLNKRTLEKSGGEQSTSCHAIWHVDKGYVQSGTV